MRIHVMVHRTFHGQSLLCVFLSGYLLTTPSCKPTEQHLFRVWPEVSEVLERSSRCQIPPQARKQKRKAKNTLVDQACFTMEGVAAEVAEDKRHQITDGEPESGVEETMSLKKLSDCAKESDLGYI
ncbi:hypothetical protein BJV82DRAFT_705436 [Fennellomyces sp. T-0311]|nr:hypothetical protein BJV82DRAFT_705436 [Fennellomyces sp. T-0311]